MHISRPFIERPVATSLLSAAILLAGGVAYLFLPVAPLPKVDFPTLTVQANLPGASPETMASSVATPLERSFGRIAGVTEMTSSSQLGATNITLQLDLDRDINAASRDVQAAINAAAGQLPTTLPSPPRYRLTACERRKASASFIQRFSVRYLYDGAVRAASMQARISAAASSCSPSLASTSPYR